MEPHTKSRKKAGSDRGKDAVEKDLAIAELKDRIAVLENELREKQDEISRSRLGHKQGEAFLRLIQFVVNNAPESIVVLDANGRYILTNEMDHKALGYTLDEQMAMRVWDKDPNFDEVTYREVFDQAKKQGNITFESTHLDKQGIEHPVDIILYYINFEGNEYLCGFAKDATERKQIIDKLAEKERFLSNIFECIQDGISVLDSDLNIIRVNSAMEKRYGKHITSKKCYQAYHGRQEPCEKCPSIRAIKEGTTQTEIVSDLKGWSEIYAFPLTNDRGEVTGVIEHVRDITERKRAEEALRRSEEGLRRSQEIAHLGSWELDIVDNRLSWSDEVYRIFGLQPPEFGVSYEAFLEIVHPDDRAAVDAAYTGSVRDGLASYEIEHRIVRRSDGKTRVVHEKCEHFRDEAGRIVRSVGMVQDITERVRVEEDLRKSEEKYRFLVENSKDLIWKIDLEGRWTFVGGNVEGVTGFKPEEVMGKTIWNFLVPECHGPIKEKLLKRMRGEDIAPYTTWIINKDGGHVPLEVSTTSIVDGDGKIVGVQGISRDITQRTRAEEAIRLANAYNRSLIEASLDPLVTIAPDGKITDVNMATELATGIPREELVGTDFTDYFTDPDMARRGYEQVFEEGSVKDYPLELRHRDGHITPVLYNANVYRDESGEIIGVFAAARDIAERKRSEEALMDAKAQAELYVDLMGHDINNMNQISLGFLELARNIIEMKGVLGEENIVLLDKATDALKDSSQLIDSVRKLQREKMGMYEPQVLDIGIVIEDAVEHFDRIPGRDVKITYDRNMHYPVRANSLLKDVFINLVGNAIKHSRGPLEIEIHTRLITDNGKSYCRVEVEDNGPGIPDNLKATLFDRLNLTATRAKGKGFGLCLIKILMDDYKGKFWVEDRVKGDHTKGARFVVLLPAVEK